MVIWLFANTIKKECEQHLEIRRRAERKHVANDEENSKNWRKHVDKKRSKRRDIKSKSLSARKKKGAAYFWSNKVKERKEERAGKKSKVKENGIKSKTKLRKFRSLNGEEKEQQKANKGKQRMKEEEELK